MGAGAGAGGAGRGGAGAEGGRGPGVRVAAGEPGPRPARHVRVPGPRPRIRGLRGRHGGLAGPAGRPDRLAAGAGRDASDVWQLVGAMPTSPAMILTPAAHGIVGDDTVPTSSWFCVPIWAP